MKNLTFVASYVCYAITKTHVSRGFTNLGSVWHQDTSRCIARVQGVGTSWNDCSTKSLVHLHTIATIYPMAPVCGEVCGEVQLDVRIHPWSGVRQGDPLSLALFSVLRMALVYDVSTRHYWVEILL